MGVLAGFAALITTWTLQWPPDGYYHFGGIEADFELLVDKAGRRCIRGGSDFGDVTSIATIRVKCLESPVGFIQDRVNPRSPIILGTKRTVTVEEIRDWTSGAQKFEMDSEVWALIRDAWTRLPDPDSRPFESTVGREGGSTEWSFYSIACFVFLKHQRLVLPISIVVLVCCTAGILVQALRRSRAGVCPACTYPLTGLPPGSPCPECGGGGGGGGERDEAKA